MYDSEDGIQIFLLSSSVGTSKHELHQMGLAVTQFSSLLVNQFLFFFPLDFIYKQFYISYLVQQKCHFVFYISRPPLPKQKKKKKKEKKRKENFGTKDSCILVTLIRLFTRVTGLSNSPNQIRMLVDLKFCTTNDVMLTSFIHIHCR